MKRHISIDIKSALANDITVLEWCLLECIHFSSNNETGYCYASKESLRKHIGVSNGQIYKMIDRLENLGLIKKHKHTGHLKTTEKWVEVERGDTLQKMENDSPKNGDEPLQKMETLLIKKENEGRIEENPPTPRGEIDVEIVSDFDQFWKAYPKKTGKVAAEKAFKKAKKNLPPTADLIAIIEAQKQQQQWKKDGGQYIPNPATWLNQGRWEDEPAEVRQQIFSDKVEAGLEGVQAWLASKGVADA
jgi:DNA-binding PadR family transcriptional regulator